MSTVSLTIDGREVRIPEGSSILVAARAAGRYVPTLCHHDDLPPEVEEHSCGLCLVSVDGCPVRACATPAMNGATVETGSADLHGLRRDALRKLLALHPPGRSGEFGEVCEHIGIPDDLPAYLPSGLPLTDNPLFTAAPDLCVACGRCVRVCNDVRGIGALERAEVAGRPVALPKGGSLSEAGCRFCGACVEVCPSGALTDRDVAAGDRDEALVPCRSACPAGVNIPEYIGLVADGRPAEAAALVRNRVPFPTVLGHICYRPCEHTCLRSRLSDSIAICDLERVSGRSDFIDPAPGEATGRRVAVIGSGPAGLSAAFYLRILGHDATVIEKASRPGGMLRYGIPKDRLPREALDRDISVLERMGVQFELDHSVGEPSSGPGLGAGYDAVLLATGSGPARVLDIPGADLEGVVPALEFLASSSRDRVDPEVEGRRVVVVGGEGVAMDAAAEAARHGAETVHVFCLESKEEIPAHRPEIERAEELGVVIRAGWGPLSLVGAGGRVSAVEVVRCTAVFDEDGRFAPEYDASHAGRAPAEVVIIAAGQEPDPAPRKATEGIKVPVLEAGDVVTGPTNVTEAVAAGRRAALSVHACLGFDTTLTEFVPEPPPPKRLAAARGFDILPRKPLPLGDDDARAEADRCLRCHLRLDLTAPPRPPGA